MQKEPPTVLFLVSPNFGLLDNWLPVFWELRKRRPEITITAFFPKPRIVLEIDPNEVTAMLAQSVIEKVVFKSSRGAWITSHSFREAKEIVKKSGMFERVIKKIQTALGIRNNIHVPVQDMNVKAICFDVMMQAKKECREILEQFPQAPRFSILHGLAIADYEIQGADMASSVSTIAYLFSKHEKEAHKKNYGLQDADLKIVGVPRHDPGWIETILRNAPSDIPVSWNKYLFVISRPALDGFFPREKKSEALKNIQKLANELHAKVVVRLHPTERVENEGLYEEIFGKETYGKDWIYSSSHPFVIGKGSLFAISFYSGVAIDMLALGVPTIQMVDFTPGGKTGAIMEYKKKGLVLGADTYEELKHQARRILDDKNGVMKQLMPKYKEFFAPVGNPISAIVDDISKVV